MKAYGIRVEKREAEKKLRELREKGLLIPNLKAIHDGGYVIFPVKEGEEVYEFEERKRLSSLKEEMEKRGIRLSKHSYDVIGEIAIVEIGEEDRKWERDIGKLVAEINKVRTVYAKESAMEGVYRVRKLRLIYGEDNPITLYKENGVKMKLNVKEVFFSPRLSYERKRIAEKCKGEKVLVMFAGVGPFALVAARYAKKVVGVEINPRAVEYFRENVKMNNLTNVEVIEGDVSKVIDEEFIEKYGKFDRVIMPLPKDGERFLSYAERVVKRGGFIHFYSFVSREKPLEEAMDKVKRFMKKKAKVVFWRKVRDYSKDIIQVVVDLKVKE